MLAIWSLVPLPFLNPAWTSGSSRFTYYWSLTWRKWQPVPVLLPGKSHGPRSLVGYSPWGRKESDTTERLHFTSLASVWGECNCVVVWTFFGNCLSLGLKWKLTFSSNVTAAEFSKFAGILRAASSFRTWPSSAGIPSPPLALFVVMLPKAPWLWTPGYLTLGEWSYHNGYMGH